MTLPSEDTALPAAKLDGDNNPRNLTTVLVARFGTWRRGNDRAGHLQRMSVLSCRQIHIHHTPVNDIDIHQCPGQPHSDRP